MTTVAEARARTSARINYLVQIFPKNYGGNFVPLSEEAYTYGGFQYLPLIEEVSGVEEAVSMAEAGALNASLSITFRNAPFSTYSNLVLLHEDSSFVGAIVYIYEVYRDQPDGDVAPNFLFIGVLEEPRNITRESFTCGVTSLPHYFSRFYERGMALQGTYPDISPEDIGAQIPDVIGDHTTPVPTIRTTWGATTTLFTAVDDAATTLVLSDASEFPSSGSVWIDGERISYTGKSTNSLTGCTRGAGGTTAVPHGYGSSVLEYRTSSPPYQALICEGEIDDITEVYGRYQGQLVRIGGATLTRSGGKSFVNLPSELFVVPVSEDLTVAKTGTVTKTGAASKSGTVTDGIGVTDDIALVNAYPTPVMVLSTVELFWDAYDPDPDLGVKNITFTGVSGITSGARIYVPWSIYLNVPPTGTGYVGADIDGTSLAIVLNGSGGYGSGTWHSGTYTKIVGAWDTSIDVDAREATGTGNNPSWRMYIGAGYTGSAPSQHGEQPALSLTGSASKTGTVTDGIAVNDTIDVDDTIAVSGGGEMIFAGLLDSIFVTCEGLRSPDAAHYGTLNVKMRRPDYVMKWWIVNRLFFGLDAIDTTSFNAAGTWYSTNNYYIDGWTDEEEPLEVLQRMAFNCRSTVRYTRGKWYLDVIPDTAPAADHTIDEKELAGEGASFAFEYSPEVDIENYLKVKFHKNLGPRFNERNEWKGALTKSSIPSGHDKRVGDVFLEWVSDATMAGDVADSIVARRNRSFRLVEFVVFWEHFGIVPGDTISLTGDIFSGESDVYFVEGVERVDRFHARINAREWY